MILSERVFCITLFPTATRSINTPQRSIVMERDPNNMETEPTSSEDHNRHEPEKSNTGEKRNEDKGGKEGPGDDYPDATQWMRGAWRERVLNTSTVNTIGERLESEGMHSKHG
ncbi:hypothetical protein FIBSPDRAFT_995675 [Athelia psychrophila]|uniref:Uncharacterized protein n=1 Tax=Athelia psychrophila TaxID=1759441 RepID=A0A165XCF5_9AGAM|nr:hypothetical protein FIBSPDRAFT_995675 [Fibularhizoctonia sp. CBS 109695]